MSIIITDSMEWVYHDRGKIESSLVRKYEEECYKLLVDKRSLDGFIYELNTRWFPDGKQIVLFNPNDPIQMFRQIRQIYRNTNFDIELKIKDEEKIPELFVA